MKLDYAINYNHLAKPLELADLQLFQLGRAFCQEGYSCPRHYHPYWYELTVVTDGEGVVWHDEVATKVKSGDVFFSSVLEYHSIVSSDAEPLKYDFFSFFPKNPSIQEALSHLGCLQQKEGNRLVSNSRIPFLTSAALHELSRGEDQFSRLSLNNILCQIVVYAIRGLEKKESVEQLPSKANLLCYQIMEYIHSHIYTMEKVSDLSGGFNYSYAYLSHLFKQTTGNTIIEFYNLARLAVAESLVQESSLSFTEIGEKLKFSSLYSFSNAFKKHFGYSPSQCRAMAKKK